LDFFPVEIFDRVGRDNFTVLRGGGLDFFTGILVPWGKKGFNFWELKEIRKNWEIFFLSGFPVFSHMLGRLGFFFPHFSGVLPLCFRCVFSPLFGGIFSFSPTERGPWGKLLFFHREL